jgi:hypothetical protein
MPMLYSPPNVGAAEIAHLEQQRLALKRDVETAVGVEHIAGDAACPVPFGAKYPNVNVTPWFCALAGAAPAPSATSISAVEIAVFMRSSSAR